MESYSVEAYQKAGCKLLADEMAGISGIQGSLVHGLTGGKVCDTGCHAFNLGRCSAYQNLVNDREVLVAPVETVRAEAKRRGISISEVRRQKKAFSR